MRTRSLAVEIVMVVGWLSLAALLLMGPHTAGRAVTQRGTELRPWVEPVVYTIPGVRVVVIGEHGERWE